MKNMMMALLISITLAACSLQPTEPIPTISNTATAPTLTLPTPTLAPTQTTTNDQAEEVEIKSLVEDFGMTLKTVSLLSPDAAQEIEKRYAEFVSPTLLDMWKSDVSKAPGRIVSSPWPDRIELTDFSKESPDRYVVTGFIIEVTSVEEVNGGAAARIPVRIVVQKDQGTWLITEYSEGR